MSTPRPATRRADMRPEALAAQIDYADKLSKSSLIPEAYQRNAPNVLWAIGYAEMLDLHPIAVMTGMHIMGGKPSATASFQAMLVRMAGHRLDVWMEDDDTAVAQLTRADTGATFTVRWDGEKARKAELVGNKMWKKFPHAMRKARATTEVARDAAPDALYGILYTPEELGAEVDEEGTPVGSASEPASAAPAPAPAPASEPTNAPKVADTAAATGQQAPDADGDWWSQVPDKWKQAIDKAVNADDPVGMLDKLGNAAASSLGGQHPYTTYVTDLRDQYASASTSDDSDTSGLDGLWTETVAEIIANAQSTDATVQQQAADDAGSLLTAGLPHAVDSGAMSEQQREEIAQPLRSALETLAQSGIYFREQENQEDSAATA